MSKCFSSWYGYSDIKMEDNLWMIRSFMSLRETLGSFMGLLSWDEKYFVYIYMCIVFLVL